MVTDHDSKVFAGKTVSVSRLDLGAAPDWAAERAAAKGFVAGEEVGRLAVSVGQHPDILPVNSAVDRPRPARPTPTHSTAA